MRIAMGRPVGVWLLLGILSAVASAQEVTMITVPQQQREGTLTSASVVVPSDATGWIRLTASIAAADYEDTTLSFVLRTYRLDQSTGTWRLINPSISWRGGRVEDPEFGVNPMPYGQTQIDDLRGQTVRVEVDVPVRMRLGGTLVLRATPED